VLQNKTVYDGGRSYPWVYSVDWVDISNQKKQLATPNIANVWQFSAHLMAANESDGALFHVGGMRIHVTSGMLFASKIDHTFISNKDSLQGAPARGRRITILSDGKESFFYIEGSEARVPLYGTSPSIEIELHGAAQLSDSVFYTGVAPLELF